MGGIAPYYLKQNDNNMNNNYSDCTFFNDKAIHNHDLGCEYFYLLDNFNSFKNSNKKGIDYIYFKYYYNNEIHIEKFPKSEIILKYNLIQIIHNEKKIKILVSKDTFKKESSPGDNILIELRKSKFYTDFTDYFKIDFKSKNISLLLINNLY